MPAAPAPSSGCAPVHTAPAFTQLAALCWRERPGGGIEVLLVTSSAGRWILPKGWPMDGLAPHKTARIEAWEEAGVRKGKATRTPVGEYMAIKRTPQGDDVPCLHRVYAIRVRRQEDRYPEAHRRDRVWLPPAEAAGRVDEEGLRDILRAFDPAASKRPLREGRAPP
ncbi:NUDIX hydrolase [Rubellimicrobium sp. CFH 75288]|uniref:NUDIX hydrolase n=1 Tax=Rubellimicrobium sp. CFH 75288 TaxID=2697034 RepID=UPI0014129B03|nr:NUDIX domain-containing protein [Rubellimicrobium sp. CFH 75288]